MLYQALGQVALSLPLALALPGQWISPARVSARGGVLLLCAGAAGFVSQILSTQGLMRQRSAAATAMRLWDVPITFALQAAALPAEPVRPLSCVGAVVIISAMLLIMTSARKDSASDAAEPELARARLELGGELDDERIAGDTSDDAAAGSAFAWSPRSKSDATGRRSAGPSVEMAALKPSRIPYTQLPT